MKISPLSNVEMNSPLSSTSEVAGANSDITFQYGNVDEIINSRFIILGLSCFTASIGY